MEELHKNYIGGEWRDGEAAPNINPSNTNDIVGQYVRATAEDTQAAIAAAKAAFPAWSRTGIQQRHDILAAASAEIMARKDELGRLLSREEGKTLAEGIGETIRAAQIFDFFAGECLRLSGEKLASTRPGLDVEITREPVGVVGIITPWNTPFMLSTWKIAPALAAGCTFVSKPAKMTPFSAIAIAVLAERAGVPKGAEKKAKHKDKGGASALRGMVRALRNEVSVGMTADLPPGPARKAGEGIVALARLSGKPIVPVAVTTRARVVLNNWDRYQINLPFSKGAFVWGDPIYVPGDASGAALEEARRKVEEALNAVTAEADALVGRPGNAPAPHPSGSQA